MFIKCINMNLISQNAHHFVRVATAQRKQGLPLWHLAHLRIRTPRRIDSCAASTTQRLFEKSNRRISIIRKSGMMASCFVLRVTQVAPTPPMKDFLDPLLENSYGCLRNEKRTILLC